MAHDPYVREADCRRALGERPDVPLADDLGEALSWADYAALVTRHREYQALDLWRAKDVMCINGPALSLFTARRF